ncbi:hypothetical protein NEAUS03_0629 [Nematocida ausubeli]|nr:hypothetical protein NEAUS03_0629 [Nematocida ausubeli]
MVLYTCVTASPNQEKTQEDPLSMIGELEKSFTDTKNNVVYKNRQFEDGGREEAEKEVDPSVQVEQLENATNMRGTSAPLEAFMLDKYSNFSSTKEKKREMCDKMNEAQHAVEIFEKEYRKKADILGKMNSSVESFYNIFLVEKKNLTDIKKKYNESMVVTIILC